MGTCRIVGWCENAKCIGGCLAEKAVEQEREACAKVCDDVAKNWNQFDDVTAAQIKQQIMARSNVKLRGSPASGRVPLECRVRI